MFKSVIVACALVLGAATATADVPPAPTGVAPDVFVKSVYDTKLESEAVSADFGRAMTDSLILNHFTPELLALYKSTYHSDEPIIDADVFMMAQEWAPTDVAAVTKAQTADAATVEASFKIADKAQTVTYTLKAVKGGGWEIDDIASAEGSLRKWIGEAAKP